MSKYLEKIGLNSKKAFENKINNDIQIFQEKLNDTPKDVDALFGLALIAKNTNQYKFNRNK